MAAAAAAGAASAELVIGWCIFGLLLLVGEALGVSLGLGWGQEERGGSAAGLLVGTLVAPPLQLLLGSGRGQGRGSGAGG